MTTRRNPKAQPVRTFLLDPKYVYADSGGVASITGTCPECKKRKRTIHAADAFQVRRCAECQRKARRARARAARKARRVAAGRRGGRPSGGRTRGKKAAARA